MNGGTRASNGSAIDASSHDAVGSSTALETVRTFDNSQASQGASIFNKVSSQTGKITDGETSTAVCVAVFAQESGIVWGSASMKLHDAMDDCLEAGYVLVAIPSCEHHLAYSITDTDHAHAVARGLLC